MNNLSKLFWKIILIKKPVEYARKKGVRLGQGNSFVDHPCFASEPYLVSFGDNNRVSFGVCFVTHDGGRWVLDHLYKEEGPFYKYGKIEIGNNNFIGANVLICPNIKIGDNCIIAAGSIVTKSIPSNEVWGGTPAHYIMRIDEYYQKVKNIQDKYNNEKMQKNKENELKRIFYGE